MSEDSTTAIARLAAVSSSMLPLLRDRKLTLPFIERQLKGIEYADEVSWFLYILGTVNPMASSAVTMADLATAFSILRQPEQTADRRHRALGDRRAIAWCITCAELAFLARDMLETNEGGDVTRAVELWRAMASSPVITSSWPAWAKTAKLDLAKLESPQQART